MLQILGFVTFDQGLPAVSIFNKNKVGSSPTEFTLVDYPTMDDRSVMNLKSSDRLKQEIDNEQRLKFVQVSIDCNDYEMNKGYFLRKRRLSCLFVGSPISSWTRLSVSKNLERSNSSVIRYSCELVYLEHLL